MTFLYKYYKLIGQAISYRANIEEWLKTTLNIDEINEANREEVMNYLNGFIETKSTNSNVKFRIVQIPFIRFYDIQMYIKQILNAELSKIDNDFEKDTDKLNSSKLAYKLTDSSKIMKEKIDKIILEESECHPTGFHNLNDLACVDDCNLKLLVNRFYISETLQNIPAIISRDIVDQIYVENDSIIKRLTVELDKYTDEIDKYIDTLPKENKEPYLKLISICKEYFEKLYDLTIESLLSGIEFASNYIEHLISNEAFLTSDYESNVCSISEYPANVRRLVTDDASIPDYVGKFKSSEDMLSGSNMNFGKKELQSSNMMNPHYAINDIEKRYESKFKKVDSIIVELFKIKPQKLKNKLNAMYFKKWLGRIPGMYNAYGNEARITENRMKGDPTTILSETAPAYLEKIATETNKLFQEIINLSRRITASSDIHQKLNHAKSFCETYKIEDESDPKAIEKTIKNECLYRICKCLFQGNQIYGYTPEGIVENGKFPNANHVITSLFIENAHEQPEPQTISQIFSSPESMTTFAFPEKLINYENLLKKVTSSVSQNFNRKMVSSVHNGLELNFKNYSNSLIRKSSQIDGGDAENAKLNKQLAKSIENGIVNGLDLIIDQKIRVMQCIGCCYDMLGRVQRLAKLCVAALHQVEIQHSDSRHKAGVNNAVRNATNVRLNKINQANNAGYMQ